MLFSRKLNRPLHPPIFMQNHQITEVDSHKHLGLYLSNDCTWHKHINYITEKAWTRINIMRRLKFKLDRKSLEQIYLVFIRPLLEYGDIIWDSCLQSEKQDLEKIQIEAARIATGVTKLVSIVALYREIRWDSLDERRRNINWLYSIRWQTLSLRSTYPLLFHKLSAMHHVIIWEILMIYKLLKLDLVCFITHFCFVILKVT